MSERDAKDEGSEELERNISRLLGAARQPPAIGEGARARIEAALIGRQAAIVAERARPFWTRRRGQLAIGGGVLAAAAVVVLGVSLRGGAPEAMVYANAGPFVKHVVLRDGTEVALDVGAELVESAPRKVRLSAGQAIFDVKKGEGQLALSAAGGEALAVGTRFWVKVEEGRTDLAVARGVVTVSGQRGASRAVGAGQAAALRADTAAEVERAPRLSHLFAFAREEREASSSASAPGPRGSLIGREPRWGREAPLPLRDLTIDVRVEDGVARTTVDQTFFNDRDRQLEGVYQFPIPHGASISRLGMYVDGQLMEGAVVGRDEGRDIYEGIVEQRRDPALLEWMSGDSFRMRVFPLPARSEKRVFLSYTERLPRLYDTRRLVVPIPPMDLPAKHARFRVVVADAEHTAIRSTSHEVTVTSEGADKVVSWQADEVALGKDLVLSLRDEPDGRQGAPGDAPAERARFVFSEGGASFALLTARPDLRKLAPPKAQGGPRRVAVVYDVSASRSGPDLDRQSALTLGLLDALDDADRVTLITVGHDAKVLPGGLVRADALDRAKVAGFLNEQALGLGDSRLDLGLRAAVDALGEGEGEAEIVYVGDGALVSDEADPADGPERLVKIVEGRARFLGVGLGENVDLGVLTRLADATSGLAVSMGEDEDPAQRAFDLVAATYTPCLQRLSATASAEPGKPAAEVLLGSTRLCDGEELAALVKRAGESAGPLSVVVRGELDGQPWSETLSLEPARATKAAYLPRLFAEWKVAALLASDAPSPEPEKAGSEPSPADARSRREQEIVALAKKSFLVTPYTSLLVLENDEMYRQFKVEKQRPTGWAVYDAPAKIPVVYEPRDRTVLPSGVAWDAVRRSPTRLFWEARPRYRGQVRMGALALTGIGEGGGGFGTGFGRLGGAGARRPLVERRVTRTETLRSELAQTVTRARPDFQDAARRNGRLSGEHRVSARDIASLAPAVTGFGEDWRSDAFEGNSLSAFGSSADPRFGDLTELAPGMFDLPVDSAVDLCAASDPRPTFGADVRALLARGARPASPLVDSRGLVRVDASAAAIRVDRRLDTGLRERALLQGGTLTHQYPELGVSTVRSGPAGLVWWLAAEVPFVLPPPALLEGLAVTLEDAHTLRVAAPAEVATSDAHDVPDLRWELDDAGRVVRVRFGSGAASATISVAYEGDAIKVTDRAGVTRTYGNDDAPAADDSGELAAIDLPLRNPGYWDDVLARSKDAGERRRARHQLLATYAALSDANKVHDTVAALASEADGALTRGELTLGSLGISGRADAKALVSAGPKGDPVRAYLAAGLSEGDSGAFLRVASASSGGVATLARFRAGLIDVDRGRVSDARSLETRVAALPEGSFFRYVLVRRAVDALPWEREADQPKLWGVVARDPVIAPIADRAVLRSYRYANEHTRDAGERLERSFDAAMRLGYPFQLDWQLRSVLGSTRGDAGVAQFGGRWRAAVLRRGNAEQTLRLLEAMLDPYRMGDGQHPEELGPVLRRLGQAPGASEPIALQAAAMLVGAGRAPEASRVLAPWADADTPSLEAVELASVVAEEQGDLGGAIRRIERLLEMTRDEPLELSTIRVWYGRLVQLSLRRASLPGIDERAAIDAALRAAARWRREDPGNDAVDELIASSLYGLGREDEARAVIASVLDRRPADGGAWATVARLVERQGDLDRAARLWQRAAKVEPTNPTWLLSEAQTRIARGEDGDAAEADALLARIERGKWQDRFGNVVDSARRLRKP